MNATFTRRELLAGCAALGMGGLADSSPAMGVVIHSFPVRLGESRRQGENPPISDPIRFVDLARQFGAGGAQVGLGARDSDYASRLRAALDRHGMYLEGIVSLPRTEQDLDRLAAELSTARSCGAGVVRTVCLSGRRYETFTTAEGFRKFADQSRRSLELALPVAEKHKVRLAIENHKDWRVQELVPLLKAISSPYLGVCLDTGNSIALLEDPVEVVQALAPWSFTTHFKDMAVAEYADGFLLSEVPLGEGFLPLAELAATLRKARPEIRLNLEMITRDPLRVPCLTEGYWATLDALPARELAAALARIKKWASPRPLPTLSGRPPREQLEIEDRNVRTSLAYARARSLS